MSDSKNANKYWTAEEIDRARTEGARIAKWLRENAAPHLEGCLCEDCRAASKDRPEG